MTFPLVPHENEYSSFIKKYSFFLIRISILLGLVGLLYYFKTEHTKKVKGSLRINDGKNLNLSLEAKKVYINLTPESIDVHEKLHEAS